MAGVLIKRSNKLNLSIGAFNGLLNNPIALILKNPYTIEIIIDAPSNFVNNFLLKISVYISEASINNMPVSLDNRDRSKLILANTKYLFDL